MDMAGWVVLTGGWMVWQGQLHPALIEALPVVSQVTGMAMTVGLFIAGALAITIFSFLVGAIGLLLVRRRKTRQVA